MIEFRGTEGSDVFPGDYWAILGLATLILPPLSSLILPPLSSFRAYPATISSSVGRVRID